MISDYWYSHRWQMIFAFLLFLFLSSVVTLSSIPKSDSEVIYDGLVVDLYIASSRYTGDMDLVITVDVGNNLLKKVTSTQKKIGDNARVRCVKTYLFNSESCHIIIDLD